MSLELTTTRRRVNLGSTTMVDTVPPYMKSTPPPYPLPGWAPSEGDGRDFQPYGLGNGQVRVNRRHLRLLRGLEGRLRGFNMALGDTTMIDVVPPWLKSTPPPYPLPGWAPPEGNGRDFQPYGLGAHDSSREMMGFGVLDSVVSTREVQQKLRRAGFCEVGAVDNAWGNKTAGALGRFAGTYGYGVADFEGRGDTVRMETQLLAKLNTESSGLTDRCGSGSSSGGGGGTTDPVVDNREPADDGGVMQASVFSNPMLWLGLGAATLVAYYAYNSSDEGDMMMLPSRL